MWRCNDELRVRADVLHRSTRRDAKHYIGNHIPILIGSVIWFLKSTCYAELWDGFKETRMRYSLLIMIENIFQCCKYFKWCYGPENKRIEN